MNRPQHLDVSIQDQILTLIRELCIKNNVGCMLVTHDMGVVSNVTDKIAVMYRGDLVEFGETAKVLRHARTSIYSQFNFRSTSFR